LHHKNVTVANVLSSTPINISFRRTLDDTKWERWTNLLHRLVSIQLSDSEDTFKWGLTASHQFTVKSMYNDLLNENVAYLKKYIWKMKVPLKIRIFMWFLQKKVILTKDNLIKRHWQGDEGCCFCDQKETVQHLFITCPFIRMIWRIVYMSFNIPPPFNITNLFGNWLNGVPKKDKAYIRVGVCAVLWAIWKVRNDWIFNKKKLPSFFVGYSGGYPPDLCVVLSTAGGRPIGCGYWVQPIENGGSGFLQPVRMACWPVLDMMMQRRFMSMLRLRWLVSLRPFMISFL
jgi:hypothetical protein